MPPHRRGIKNKNQNHLPHTHKRQSGKYVEKWEERNENN